MTDIFFDLLQTPALVLPIFIGLALVIFTLMLWRTKPDHNDYLLEQEEARRSREQESKLKYMAEHGDLPPAKERMDALNRGADRPKTDATSSPVINTPYSDMAARYGFSTHKHHDRGELIFYDTRFDTLEASKRMVVVNVDRVVNANRQNLRKLISQARSNVNRKAQRAGLLAKRERRGNPGREVKA